VYTLYSIGKNKLEKSQGRYLGKYAGQIQCVTFERICIQYMLSAGTEKPVITVYLFKHTKALCEKLFMYSFCDIHFLFHLFGVVFYILITNFCKNITLYSIDIKQTVSSSLERILIPSKSSFSYEVAYVERTSFLNPNKS